MPSTSSSPSFDGDSDSSSFAFRLDPDNLDDGATDIAETLTQAGWLAKGLIFVVIGLLGLEIARRGYSSDDADQGGALSVIAEGPAGRVMVLVVGTGLLLFALWQFWLATTRPADELLMVAKRIGWAGLGLAYGMLGITGIEIALTGNTQQSGGEGGATSPEGIADLAFEFPGGRIFVAAIGIGTIIVGAYHLRKGWQVDFLDDIETDDLSESRRKALGAMGVIGFTARALMLGIAGVLLLVAAWQSDSSEAAGLDQSLRTLVEVLPGRIAIGAASFGLLAAGGYDMITFRRQRLGEQQ